MPKKSFFNNLSSQERKIIVEGGTEKPFSGKYNNHFEAGVFVCKACKSPLYESRTKFNSNCGWPAFDEELAAEDLITLVVQINGKVRDRLEIPAGTSKEETEQTALAAPKIQPYLEGKQIRKVIVVPDRLVNIVCR